MINGYMTNLNRTSQNFTSNIINDTLSYDGAPSKYGIHSPDSMRTLNSHIERTHKYYEKADRAKFIASGTLELAGKSQKARK